MPGRIADVQAEIFDIQTRIDSRAQTLAAGFDFADALHHASYRLCTSVATFDDKRFARKATAQKRKPAVKVFGS